MNYIDLRRDRANWERHGTLFEAILFLKPKVIFD